MTTTVLPAPAPARAHRYDRVTNWWRETVVFAGRNLQHIRQVPEKLLDVTLQPLMFVLLFAFVFGGAIGVPGGNYREYIIGGILVQSLTFGMTGPATAIATDLTEGVIDRFRSLPVARSAYLSGHFVAEIGGMALSMFVLLATGLLVGWRVHNGLLSTLTAFVLLVLFASVMVWIGTLIGLLVRTPDAVMGVAFTVVFPLTFLSNAFVPTETLPAALQTIAEWNPVSVLVASVRELFGNNGAVTTESWPLQHATPVAFATCLLLLVLIVPQCLRRYRARTVD